MKKVRKKTITKIENNFLIEIKEGLLAEKEKIVAILATPKPVEEVDFAGDEIDAIQGKISIEIANQLKGRDELKLIRINAALRRIDEKNYGICGDCGDDISQKRLLAQPLIMICIGCAEEQESEQKKVKTKERIDDMTIIKKWSTK